MSNEQEKFWQGRFGIDYIDRNFNDKNIANVTAFFASVLKRAHGVSSVLEFGCNAGLNLIAINRILPKCMLTAVEINEEAVKLVKNLGISDVVRGSIMDYSTSSIYDLTLVKGVLIHVAPEDLEIVYNKLYSYSSKYILVAEYYNPSPVAIEYRGHNNKLFKRDFAGDMMDRYNNLKLIDYGFIYHRDPMFPQDDITWFLMEKTPR